MGFFGSSRDKDATKMDNPDTPAVDREAPLLPHRDSDVGVLEPPHRQPRPILQAPSIAPAPSLAPSLAPAPSLATSVATSQVKKEPFLITGKKAVQITRTTTVDPDSATSFSVASKVPSQAPPKVVPQALPEVVAKAPPPRPPLITPSPEERTPVPLLAHPNPEPSTDYMNANEDDDTMWIKTKIPNLSSKRRWRKIKNTLLTCDCLNGVTTASLCASLANLPAWVKMASAAGAALVILGVVGLTRYTVEYMASTDKSSYNVAFIGNSNIFLNDLPRLVETMSQGHMFQDSCLHAGGSMLKIVRTGNGMYNRWTTENALIESVEWNDNNGNRVSLYDYGACSVPQLLLGYDPELSYANYMNNFYDDGSNPCFENNDYLDYTNSFNYSEPWDYVVLADQSKRMAFEEARYEAYLSFNYTYIPILNETGSVPIILQPHAFWSDQVNMTGLDDVTNFTSHIYNGALKYQTFLTKALKKKQKARLAPVGNAFLVVYNQDRNMWSKLFLEDNIYPSPYGTYLYGLVVYGTIYGHLPAASAVVLEDMSTLWSNARAIQFGNGTDYPSAEDALYLYNVAKKVAVHHFVPKMPDVSASE
jgi:hypothetical protein